MVEAKRSKTPKKKRTNPGVKEWTLCCQCQRCSNNIQIKPNRETKDCYSLGDKAKEMKIQDLKERSRG